MATLNRNINCPVCGEAHTLQDCLYGKVPKKEKTTDTERLDWLEKNKEKLFESIFTKTLRQAIDKAMEEEKETEKEGERG